jgi:hypothetical protein
MSMNFSPETLQKMGENFQAGFFRPVPLSHWLSGDAVFAALKQAVKELTRLAPKDCDVLIRAFNITVREVSYIKPHALLFRGVTDDGHDSFVVCHFTQCVAQVVYLPKEGSKRKITGFSKGGD